MQPAGVCGVHAPCTSAAARKQLRMRARRRVGQSEARESATRDGKPGGDWQMTHAAAEEGREGGGEGTRFALRTIYEGGREGERKRDALEGKMREEDTGAACQVSRTNAKPSNKRINPN